MMHHGFVVKDKSNEAILLAGGIGVAPLVFLGQKLKGKKITLLLGAKTKNELLCEQEFKKSGCEVYIATEDGSKGFKGNVVELLKHTLAKSKPNQVVTIYSCGPEAMLYQIYKTAKKYPRIECQVSFEQFMGCGIGTCCGCTIDTKSGFQKVCKDF